MGKTRWKKVYKGIEKAIRGKKKKIKKMKKLKIEKKLRIRLIELEGMAKQRRVRMLDKREGFYK